MSRLRIIVFALILMSIFLLPVSAQADTTTFDGLYRLTGGKRVLSAFIDQELLDLLGDMNT